jgi:hypothetical protein
MYRQFLLGFLLFACGLAFAAQPTAMPPKFKLNGLDASAMSSEWWKWSMASPDQNNPVKDVTGAHCAVGQSGNVWFLAGGFGSSKIKRSCAIPAGKYIFFPVVNMSYWPAKDYPCCTCKEAIGKAGLNNETALDLYVELDGVAVDDVKRYRATTKKCFNIYERVPKEFQPYNAFPSASDGFWILLKPLSAGAHTIKFGGRYNRAPGDYGRMVQDIEYQITVE